MKGSGSSLISGSCFTSGEPSFSRLIRFELGGSARAALHAVHFFFTLPRGQGLHATHMCSRLPCGQGVQSVHLFFSLPCGQGLQSAQLFLSLP